MVSTVEEHRRITQTSPVSNSISITTVVQNNGSAHHQHTLKYHQQTNTIVPADTEHTRITTTTGGRHAFYNAPHAERSYNGNQRTNLHNRIT